MFSSAGVTLTALNCNGNPLDPNPEVGPLHAKDVRDSIELAALLGVKRVVTMSGCPAPTPVPATRRGRSSRGSVYLDARDYQWNEVGIPFWKDIQARAADADVKVCIEMHPHNLVYNPATMRRLATEIDATHVGAEMDPSHLFWQGIDPVLATEHLGALVYNAAAKDTRINEAAKLNGVLDDRFGRVATGDPGALSLGGQYTEPLAGALLLGLRGRRPRPRRRLLDRVPAGPGQDRPRHGRQHRTRRPGAGPDGGAAARRRDPPDGRLPAGLGGGMTRVRWGVLSTASIGRLVIEATRQAGTQVRGRGQPRRRPGEGVRRRPGAGVQLRVV